MNTFDEKSRIHRVTKAGVAAIAIAALVSACEVESDEAIEEEIVSDDEEDVLTAEDGDWIRLDGTIESAGTSVFQLDYGDDTISVEADDWDLSQEGLALMPGDRVSVTGRVDRDVFAEAAVEASAIYVHNLGTVYYANAADEEEFGLAAVPTRAATEGVDYTGWVTGSSRDGFTLGADATLINVDTSGLNTPLARDGIQAGDRVYVWGDLELSNDGQSKLVAEGLVELIDGGNSAETGSETAQAGTDETS